jgi:hypothetical protein
MLCCEIQFYGEITVYFYEDLNMTKEQMEKLDGARHRGMPSISVSRVINLTWWLSLAVTVLTIIIF